MVVRRPDPARPVIRVTMAPIIQILPALYWTDFELLDSGEGQKLERYGPYTFTRPEPQALWQKALPASAWQTSQAVFQATSEESGGHWAFRQEVAKKWQMTYPLELGRRSLRFWVQTTPGRHLGVFPEAASHWDWMAALIEKAGRPIHVLNLFGYTGLATLAACAAGASVTHVDASKKSVEWARENQALSDLQDRPVRWIVDDALKYVQRESRRGVKYDGILLDPPKFGRGPKGEVWEVFKSLPALFQSLPSVLSQKPLFVIVSAYAVKSSAVHLYFALAEMMKGFGGNESCGELVLQEKSAGRLLSSAVYARWEAVPAH
jgi:23S rRNA (cytosine1962-C5)-methyltransferase